MDTKKNKFNKFVNNSISKTNYSNTITDQYIKGYDSYVGDFPLSHFPSTKEDAIRLTTTGDVQWEVDKNNFRYWPQSTNSDNPFAFDPNIIQLNPKSIPNKIDKDLIKGAIPYNIKKDNKGNLVYELAVAGYEKTLIQKIKNGLKVILDQEEKDDLIGDDYEYLCKGIKSTKEEIEIYIDTDEFDLEKFSARIKLGIMTIFIPKLDLKSLKFTAIQADNDERDLV